MCGEPLDSYIISGCTTGILFTFMVNHWNPIQMHGVAIIVIFTSFPTYVESVAPAILQDVMVNHWTPT